MPTILFGGVGFNEREAVMSHTFGIRVIDENGGPWVDIPVWAKESGIFGESGTEYTNSDGWVEFHNPYWSEGKTVYGLYVYVRGEEFGPFDVHDGDTLSITV
jgi:hypothetical protein